MDSEESTAIAEQANSPTDFILKKKPKKLGGIVKLGGSEKNRYRALRRLKIPSAEAVELSKKTFAELREMGYQFGSLQCKPGEKPVKRTGKRPKEIRSQRSRHDALKKIGVRSNLQQLSRKSFAELKQMGFKFSAQKPVKPSFKLPKANAPKRPKANEIPIQQPPKETPHEIVPTQPPHQQAHSEGPIRVGIKDDNPMIDSQLKTLSHTILKNIAGMAQGQGPRFSGYSRKPGWLLIICDDQRSKNWLEELIPTLKPWPEARLRVIPESELPKPNIATVFISDIDNSMIEQSLSLIRAQNPLRTELWKVLNSKLHKGGVILTLSLDSQSVEYLRKKGMKASLGFSDVQFRLKGVKAHQSGTDFSATNPLPDQSLPGTSSSDANLVPGPKVLAPKRAIPYHIAVDPRETSKVCQVPPRESYPNAKSPLDIGNRGTGHKEDHQRYSSTGSYRGKKEIHGSCREDISMDIDGGDTSYSGREDNKGASYCDEEDITGDFAGGTSCNDRQAVNRGASYSRMEDMRGDISGGSSYSVREDIDRGASGREYTNRGASYNGREYIDRGPSYSSREDIKGGVSYSGDLDFRGGFGGFSYSGRENINRGADYSGREDIRGDVQGDSSYGGRGHIKRERVNSGREDIRGNIHEGASVTARDQQRGDIHGASNDSSRRDIERGYAFHSIEDNNKSRNYSGREGIDGGSSYSGRDFINRDVSCSRREDISGDIHDNSSYSQKEDMRRDIHGVTYGGTSYRDRDDTREDINQNNSNRGRKVIRGNIRYSDADDIRGNQLQQFSKREINDDFRGERHNREDSPQLPSSTGCSRGRDIGVDIRRLSGGTTDFGGREDSQIHQHCPLNVESYRNKDMVEDRRGFNEVRSFSSKGNHEHFPPSTGSYRDRNFGGDTRELHKGSTGIESRKDNQIHPQCHPSTGSYREDTSYWSRGDNQVPQTSSNWGNSGINSMGREYTKRGQGYTTGSMRGHTRGTQRYIGGNNRVYTTEDSQRYTSGDQGYAKEEY